MNEKHKQFLTVRLASARERKDELWVKLQKAQQHGTVGEILKIDREYMSVCAGIKRIENELKEGE